MSTSSKTCIIASSIPPNMAGGGRRMYNQAKYLAESGYRVPIITNTDHHNNIPNLEVMVINLPQWFKSKGKNRKVLRALKSLTFQVISFFKLFRLINKSRFELIHIVNSQSRLALPAILVAKIKSIKVINSTTLLDSDDPIAIKKSKGKLAKYIFFNLPDAIVNNSTALLEACNSAGLREDKLHYIPNPVDTNTFKPLTSSITKAKLREKFGLQNFNCILLTVSLLYKRKNIQEIIRVFKNVEKKTSSVCLAIVGSTDKDRESIETYQELRSLIKHHELDDKVFFLGTFENVNELMNACDVFVFASKREGMPNVLLEAMSAGMPIIAKELKYVTETLFANNNGLVAKDEKEFEENILRIIEDHTLRKIISVNARETAEKFFSNQVIMQKYIALYQEISKNVFVGY